MVKKENFKISIIDDDKHFSEEVAFFLSKRKFNIVSKIHDPLHYKEEFERETPHLVLLDFCMPGFNGEEVSHMINHRYPDISIVFVTAAPLKLKHLPENVKGYVSKGRVSKRLIPIIEKIINKPSGEMLSSFQKYLIQKQKTIKNRPRKIWFQLTPQEKDISLQLIRGNTPHQISDKLGVEYNTIKWHISNLRSKFGSKNIYDLLSKLHENKKSIPQLNEIS